MKRRGQDRRHTVKSKREKRKQKKQMREYHWHKGKFVFFCALFVFLHRLVLRWRDRRRTRGDPWLATKEGDQHESQKAWNLELLRSLRTLPPSKQKAIEEWLCKKGVDGPWHSARSAKGDFTDFFLTVIAAKLKSSLSVFFAMSCTIYPPSQVNWCSISHSLVSALSRSLAEALVGHCVFPPRQWRIVASAYFSSLAEILPPLWA